MTRSATQTCGFVPIVSGAAAAAAPARKTAAAAIIELKLAVASVGVSELSDGTDVAAVLHAIRPCATEA